MTFLRLQIEHFNALSRVDKSQFFLNCFFFEKTSFLRVRMSTFSLFTYLVKYQFEDLNTNIRQMWKGKTLNN